MVSWRLESPVPLQKTVTSSLRMWEHSHIITRALHLGYSTCYRSRGVEDVSNVPSSGVWTPMFWSKITYPGNVQGDAWRWNYLPHFLTSMQTLILPSVTVEGLTFTITIPDNYVRRPLPFFEEWLKALESGEFKQSHEHKLFYRPDNGYCCLGVLSKIQGRLNEKFADATPGTEDWEVSGRTGSLSPTNPCFKLLGDMGDIPEEIEVIRSNSRSPHANLAWLNDGGVTFADIAKVIRLVWCPVEG